MKFLNSYGIAFLLIILLALWLATGTLIQGGLGEGKGERSIISFFHDNDSEDNGNGQDNSENLANIAAKESAEEKNKSLHNETLQNVRTLLFTAKEVPLELTLRGQTKANAIISVRAQTSGIIEQVHVRKGQLVKRGDLICSLDSGTRKAQVKQAKAALEQAKAALKQAKADYQTNKTLREKGLAPPNSARAYEVQVEAANASLAASISALENAKLELERTKITSEVSGIVQAPLANIGDMLGVGASCATIVQLDPILFSAKVAESKVGLLREGMKAEIKTVEGQKLNGELSYIASLADSATRSFDIEIKAPNKDNVIRAGLSSVATIFVGKTKVHIIPQSSLTLNNEGDIGVKIVDNKNRVHFVKVEIVRDNSEGVWVKGLPEMAQIIILGQEYVIENQLVDVTLVDRTIAEGQ